MCVKSCRLCSESNWELGLRYYSMKQLGCFSVLRTIPLKFFMWYYALANKIYIGKSVTFVLEVLLNYVQYTINYRKHFLPSSIEPCSLA